MIYIIVAGLAGLIGGYMFHVQHITRFKRSKENYAQGVIGNTVDALKEEKKRLEKSIKMKKEALQEEKKNIEKHFQEKEQLIERRESFLKKHEVSFSEKQKQHDVLLENYKESELKIDQFKDDYIEQLIASTKCTLDKARTKILNDLSHDLESSKSESIDKQASFVEDFAEEKSKTIIISTIQKYTKKNAQRMRFDPISIKKKAWEKHKETLMMVSEISSVELEYNEEQEELFVMYYNLVRRSIAHEALKQVVKKKTFSTNAIKLELKKASDNVHNHMLQLGRKTMKILNVPRDMFPDELVKLVGRLYYRTSYGQNILQHSVEVAFFCEMIAAELGADIEKAKLAGLFHDLGKAIDQDVEGGHDYLSKQILEEYEVDEDIVFAAYNHHDAEIDAHNAISRIVQAADSMSASRPGARAEDDGQYAERIRMLEEKAYATKGVRKAYAIQAGREIRAIFDSQKINDTEMGALIKTLAANIEEEGGYPGTVMVHGVREIKVSALANSR